MSTTTIRLDPKLKKRIARLAKQSGTSAHSVMVGAIEQLVVRSEKREAYFEDAEARSAEFDRTQRGLPLAELGAWFERTALGEQVPTPGARRLQLKKK